MQPTKRMSPKRMSPKMLSWNKKLAMWRKNHRRADGSLPSLKAAMKACKGRRVSTKKCRRRKSFRKHRKAPGQYSPKRASPKKMSPLHKMSAQMKAKLSPKKQSPSLLTGLFGATKKKQQKPAVFGPNAPANPMFVRGTAKKQQSPAAQKKQQKPAQKKQQSPAAQKKQQMSFGQRAFGGPAKKQQKPAQFGPNARQSPMFGRPARFA